MKATEAKLLQILQAVQQFIIPIYQRICSWTRQECEQLWVAILRTAASEKIGVHFIGSVVHVDVGLSNLGVQAPKLEIDAQQRAHHRHPVAHRPGRGALRGRPLSASTT